MLFMLVPQFFVVVVVFGKHIGTSRLYITEENRSSRNVVFILSPCLVSLDMACHECVNEKGVTT